MAERAPARATGIATSKAADPAPNRMTWGLLGKTAVSHGRETQASRAQSTDAELTGLGRHPGGARDRR